MFPSGEDSEAEAIEEVARLKEPVPSLLAVDHCHSSGPDIIAGTCCLFLADPRKQVDFGLHISDLGSLSHLLPLSVSWEKKGILDPEQEEGLQIQRSSSDTFICLRTRGVIVLLFILIEFAGDRSSPPSLGFEDLRLRAT